MSQRGLASQHRSVSNKGLFQIRVHTSYSEYVYIYIYYIDDLVGEKANIVRSSILYKMADIIRIMLAVGHSPFHEPRFTRGNRTPGGTICSTLRLYLS